jgi:hypothetical protein
MSADFRGRPGADPCLRNPEPPRTYKTRTIKPGVELGVALRQSLAACFNNNMSLREVRQRLGEKPHALEHRAVAKPFRALDQRFHTGTAVPEIRREAVCDMANAAAGRWISQHVYDRASGLRGRTG